MIDVSWNQTLKQWVHHAKGHEIVWGANNEKVPFSPAPPRSSTFPLRNTAKMKAGPVIGILSSKKTGLPFVGNLETYQRLSTFVHSQGGLVFIFTINDCHKDSIKGFVYDLSTNRWINARFPIPDFVYNRIAYQIDELNPNYHSFLHAISNHSIPFFNSGFFSKWKTHCILKEQSQLAAYLPETKLITSIDDVQNFLNAYGKIIIKPTSSSQGKGIFSLMKKKNNQVLFFSNTKHCTYENLEKLSVNHCLTSTQHLMQPLISRIRYKGYPYDFRVLMQKVADEWTMTGIGVRCAGYGKLTTHVPEGGRILSIEDVQVDTDVVKQIATNVGLSLDKACPPVGEFSMDLGLDCSSHYWIFEVNSKPMVFDEPHIQTKATRQFYRQALLLTGFDASDIFTTSISHTIKE
ncbi:YheC/YheD family protein [Pseudalkalibacillus decolorationis]|uniref:YheC/YheD family endospore coat-associated protein n=1 Tax=Pseudalkalibacillus decolorationis TaxID=163879 RepID=UPI0021481C44|nr:YheC/YheD family protein [Pseudalkalibacillus decolorationis]